MPKKTNSPNQRSVARKPAPPDANLLFSQRSAKLDRRNRKREGSIVSLPFDSSLNDHKLEVDNPSEFGSINSDSSMLRDMLNGLELENNGLELENIVERNCQLALERRLKQEEMLSVVSEYKQLKRYNYSLLESDQNYLQYLDAALVSFEASDVSTIDKQYDVLKYYFLSLCLYTNAAIWDNEIINRIYLALKRMSHHFDDQYHTILQSKDSDTLHKYFILLRAVNKFLGFFVMEQVQKNIMGAGHVPLRVKITQERVFRQEEANIQLASDLHELFANKSIVPRLQNTPNF